MSRSGRQLRLWSWFFALLEDWLFVDGGSPAYVEGFYGLFGLLWFTLNRAFLLLRLVIFGLGFGLGLLGRRIVSPCLFFKLGEDARRDRFDT